MAIESKQLREIAEQVSEHFTSHKTISVRPVKGDPPNQYEVIYTLIGMIQVDDKITRATNHVVEISIPFGFPHFPPSCKPKSKIFHPDFDQAAICLGDFWHQNRSLVELITHVGRMIDGEFYSTTNAFNEEAAIWFTKHRDELPFSSALTGSIKPDEESTLQITVDTVDEPTSSPEDVEQIVLNAQIALERASRDDTIEQEEEQRKYAELVLDNYKKTARQAADCSTTSDNNHKDIVQEKTGWKKRIKLFIIVWAVIHAGGAGIYFYAKGESNKLASAEQSYNQCLDQLEINSFTAAKDSCEIALQQGKGVKIVEQERTTNLIAEIETILHSEKLQQGLGGRILVDGQYLNKEDAETLLLFKRLSSEGTDLFKQSQWAAASKKLQKAIDTGNNNSIVDTTTLPGLTSKLQTAQLQTFIQIATEKQNQKSWKEAIESYTDALAYLKELPSEIKQQYSEQLQKQLGKCQFEDFKQRGDTLFAQSDWQNARLAYKRALAIGKSDDKIVEETVSEVSLNLELARLYQAIKSGNLAFASGDWDKAIHAYKNGQAILADNKDLFTLIDSDVNIRKLAKIILQASVIKNRQTAKKYLEEKNLRAAKVRHEKVIRDIKTNSFANDSDFLKTIAESTEIIQSLEKEIFLNEKQHYLETNFQTLFTKHYPSASPGNLSHPVISLEKESPENLYFKLQCTEISGGRRTLLIIRYTYNKKSKTWDFSSGNLKKPKLALNHNRLYQKAKLPFA